MNILACDTAAAISSALCGVNVAQSWFIVHMNMCLASHTRCSAGPSTILSVHNSSAIVPGKSTLKLDLWRFK